MAPLPRVDRGTIAATSRLVSGSRAPRAARRARARGRRPHAGGAPARQLPRVPDPPRGCGAARGMVSLTALHLRAARARIAAQVVPPAIDARLGSILLRDDQRAVAGRVAAALRRDGGCLLADDV